MNMFLLLLTLLLLEYKLIEKGIFSLIKVK